ncbi:MAG: hypothetical protein FWG44_02445 [Oscillospiraceae bacterium]|nr:hypothetical protein [Oscillospiraceae bacterium]
MKITDSMKTLIGERQEIAFIRVNKDPIYKEICLKQKEDNKKIEEILKKRLDKQEYDFFTLYQEKENLRLAFQYDEVYIQGLRDALGLSMLFGIRN